MKLAPGLQAHKGLRRGWGSQAVNPETPHYSAERRGGCFPRIPRAGLGKSCPNARRACTRPQQTLPKPAGDSGKPRTLAGPAGWSPAKASFRRRYMPVSGQRVHCARGPPRSASLGEGTAAAQVGPPLDHELGSGRVAAPPSPVTPRSAALWSSSPLAAQRTWF